MKNGVAILYEKQLQTAISASVWLQNKRFQIYKGYLHVVWFWQRKKSVVWAARNEIKRNSIEITHSTIAKIIWKPEHLITKLKDFSQIECDKIN